MRAALPSLCLALLLAGCAKPAHQIGGIPRVGRPPTVVSLSPSTTEIVGVNLDVRALAGRTKSDDYPMSVASVPVVADVKPDFEKIQGIKPGILVYDSDLYGEADIKRIEAMGAQSFGFKDHTVLGFEKELYTLAGILGGETTMSGYIDRIEQARSGAEGDARNGNPSPAPKVAVVLGGGYVAGTNSFVADVVKIAGGLSVGPPSDKFAPMSPEALLTAAPDLIVVPTTKDSVEKDVAALRADPRFQAVPAVRSGRIVALPQDIVLRRGARVDQFITNLHRALLLKTQAK